MTLRVTAALDQTSIATSGGRAHLVLTLEAEAREGSAAVAPPIASVLALDVSYSMAGEPLDQVVRSVSLLTDALRPDDHVGVVAFSTVASVAVPLVAADATGKRLVRSRVARLVATASTNVEGGIDGAAALLATAPEGARRSVVVLSDGVPNVGAATPAELREVVRRHRARGISVASLGYGLDHQEDVLDAIGAEGGGGYELVTDPKMCLRAFARVLGAHADVIASSVEIVVAPADGVTVERLVSGDALRFTREGLVVGVPDLAAGSRVVVVAEVSFAPRGDRFLARVADVSVRHRDVEAGGAIARVDRDVTVEVTGGAGRALPTVFADVLLVKAERARAEARTRADTRQFGAAAAILRAAMAEIDALPGAAAPGSALGEAYETLRDEAVAIERVPDPEAWLVLRKSAVASKVASVRGRGEASARWLELATGEVPEATVTIVSGPGAGATFTLRAENVVGRTASADVALASAEVARRHAEIYALEGRFWIADLGSSLPTLVNGAAIGAVPRVLADGDVVGVGDVELRFTVGGRDQ